MVEQDKFKVITTIVAGLLAVFYILKGRFDIHVDELVAIALIIGAGSIFFAFFRNATVWIWMKFASVLGWINSRILLSIIFFLILFPIALLYKIFNKNLLELKNNKNTLYTDRSHNYVKDDFENAW